MCAVSALSRAAVRQSFAFHTPARVRTKSRPLRRVWKAGLA